MIDKMIEAAKLGGQQLNKYFGQTIKVFNKTTVADFRTTADLASEKVILKYLQKHFPHFNYYSEESGWLKNDSEYTFIIDPLDGTNNFSLGIANFSVSIALQKGKEIICGVVYNPVLEEVFYAQKSKGSFLNKKRIKLSDTKEITQATISYVCGYNAPRDILERLVKNFNQAKIKRLITNWSPALDLCLLASGRIESLICYGDDVYDNAAGKLILKEAGAVLTQFNGLPEEDELSTYFIASNNKILHNNVLKIFSKTI